MKTIKNFSIFIIIVVILARGNINDIEKVVSQNHAGEIELISKNSYGTQGNGASYESDITPDGRYIAFRSVANNLVENDTNSRVDVFVRDRILNETTRVSVSSEGEQGNADAYDIAISANGRYVAFGSSANNLVDNDNNSKGDVFLHDRETGDTIRVSVRSDGGESNGGSGGPAISGDGRFIVFHSDATNFVENDNLSRAKIFLHDMITSETTLISKTPDGLIPQDSSTYPDITNDGRFIVYMSIANNILPGDTNGWHDIFLYDRETDVTSMISISNEGIQGNHLSAMPSITEDGSIVVFRSGASNLVIGDTNGTTDIFIRNRVSGETRRISVSSEGTQGNGYSYDPDISGDGAYVAFESVANNLVSDDTNGSLDAFIHNVLEGTTERISVNNVGLEGNDSSGSVSISSNGRDVSFTSRASNLIDNDFNDANDVFLNDLRALEHRISGYIKRDIDPIGNQEPEHGINVELSNGQKTTTNEEGYYQFTVLEHGSYTITPSFDEQRFAPEERTITTPVTNSQDFIVRPSDPGEMLSLPVEILEIEGNTFEQNISATLRGNFNELCNQGRVSSWLDHISPDSEYFQTWNAVEMEINPYEHYKNCITGSDCYNDHNGIDFCRNLNYALNTEPIYAADSGTVVTHNRLWDYGTEILINHHNGYATLYGHLYRADVTIGDIVTGGSQIGIMGRTGMYSSGHHLHFGLYYDKNGDNDWDESEDVDPFGWDPVNEWENDPWELQNFNLWHVENDPFIVGPTGGYFACSTGLFTISIPINAVPEEMELELIDLAPFGNSAAGYQYTGEHFITKLSSASVNKTERFIEQIDDINSFLLPVELSVNFYPEYNIHFDMEQIAIFEYNQELGAWEILATTIDEINNKVNTQTTDQGRFSLQAPLLCENAVYEPNDTYTGATYLPDNGEIIEELFDIEVDEDYFKIEMIKNTMYRVMIEETGTGVDTVLEFIDSDGETILKSFNSNGPENRFTVEISTDSNGIYYLRSIRNDNGTYGCEATYGITLQIMPYIISLPLIVR